MTTTRKWLDYYAASFSDGMMYDVQHKECSEAFSVEKSIESLTSEDLQLAYQKTLDRVRKNKIDKPSKDEKHLTLSILISPFRITKEVKRGENINTLRVYPFWIPAKLSKNGTLSAPDENAVPFFLRYTLEPHAVSSSDMPCIANVVEVLQCINDHNFDTNSWKSYLQSCEALFNKITSSSFQDFSIADAMISEEVCLIPAKTKINSKQVLNVYTHLKSVKKAPRLLSTILENQFSKKYNLPTEDELFSLEGHYGQYSNNFPLSYSQRQSLLAFVKDKHESKSSILAVNGPPGTGKTTLLQSVIANEMVNAALKGKNAPQIAAASANHQAITNILESFESSGGKLDRWIRHLSSLGSYLISSFSGDKQEEALAKGYQLLLSRSKGLEGFYFNQLENKEIDLEEFENYYIGKYNQFSKTAKSHSIQAITDSLRAEIQHKAEKIDTILDSIASANRTALIYFPLNELEAYRSKIDSKKQELIFEKEQGENLISFKKEFDLFFKENKPPLLSHISIRAREAYATKVNLFFATSPYTKLRKLSTKEEGEASLLELVRINHQIIKDLSASLQEKEELYQKLDQVKKLREEADTYLDDLWFSFLETQDKSQTKKRQSSISSVSQLEKANIILDLTLRYECFILSVHYWEGRWLLSQQTDKLDNTKGRDSRKNVFKRISNLTPLFISTLYTLPSFASSTRLEDGDWVQNPIYELFDLLIIDEAGQVPPELGLASMGFASRALVVGDIHQIEPVWSICYPRVDKGNLEEAGLLADNSFEVWSQKGLLCSSGSLMHLAQNASRYEVLEDLGGTMLVEHRRCVNKLVAFSNEYVYKGLLQPLVGDLDYNILEDKNEKLLIPPLAYINIRGYSNVRSGSTYNHAEAEAIAKWIVKYKVHILNFYNKNGADKSLKDCVAVVTPFSQQRREVYQQFYKYGLDSDIIVGTVHALQGAEIPIVLFSPTYGLNHGNKPLFFDNGYNMLNVALTRAKHHFIVIGNMKLFNPSVASKPSSGLAKYLYENQLNELPSSFLMEDIEMESAQRVDSLKKHQRCLARAFEIAQRRIIIVSPFISIHALNADELLPKIEENVKKNIEVLVYTDYSLDMLNGKLKASSQKGRTSLVDAGAELKIVEGIHNKALVIDENILIEGSFNWLSAVRDENNPYFRYEVSQIIQEDEAKQQIIQLLKELES